MFDLGNYTEIFTKIILRNDVLATWEASTIVLEKGEPALEMDLENKVAKIKVGDGLSTFNELPYSTVTPSEIQAMIDASMADVGTISSVVLQSGTNKGTLCMVINDTTYDNIAVTGLGSAAFTDISSYATAEQGRKAERAMSIKGTIGTADADYPTLPSSCTLGETYKSVGNFTINDSISYTGVEVEVNNGDLVIGMENNTWLVISIGIAETAKVAHSLSQGISASLTGGIVGNASVANAGESIAIEVTEINTDYLKQGTKVIIFNGGSATV